MPSARACLAATFRPASSSGARIRRWPGHFTLCCETLRSRRRALHSATGREASERDYRIVRPGSWRNPGIVGKDLIDIRSASITQSRKDRDSVTIREHLPPLSIEAVKLQDSLSSGAVDPFETLKNRIENDQAALEIIRVCLTAAGKRVFDLPKSQRLVLLSGTEHGVAEHVLKHIWGDFRIWLPMVQYDTDNVLLLCYFALAEGLDKYVERWIKADISVEEEEHPSSTATSHFWRGALLRCLVDAHMLRPANKSADQAIRCLMDIVKWREDVGQRNLHLSRRTWQARMHFANFINLKAATNVVCGRLCKGWYPNTSAHLFEQVQAQLELYVGTKGNRYNTSRLAMYHPTSPDTQPFLSWLREFMHHKDQTSPLLANKKFRDTLERAMSRAIDLLAASGQNEDAIWINTQRVEAFGRAHRTTMSGNKNADAKFAKERSGAT